MGEQLLRQLRNARVKQRLVRFQRQRCERAIPYLAALRMPDRRHLAEKRSRRTRRLSSIISCRIMSAVATDGGYQSRLTTSLEPHVAAAQNGGDRRRVSDDKVVWARTNDVPVALEQLV
jgi:hypothetical protein